MTAIRSLTQYLAIAALVTVAACARGADEARVRADLQERLNEDVKPGLLEIVGLDRKGSAPLPAGESGRPRVIVYFNTTLRLVEDYAFGDWNQLGASSVAYVLGATENGVFGLQAKNRAGDVVRAYGSAVYEAAADGGWTLVPGSPLDPAAAPAADADTPPSRSKQLIDQLAAMVNLPPPGVPPNRDTIIAEELARASEAIERRVRRSDRVFTVATGPAGGEYARFGASLIAAINELAPSVRLRERPSEGSVENASLLARGEADYAIVQGDVAAAAAEGRDLFARGAPMAGLRAVGGLFPEAVHVVVLADSPVKDVEQLRGKRVDIGAPGSGTRFDAVAVLEAHGLLPAQLGEAREEGPAAAIDRLRRREIDALFVTAAAPQRELQRLAVDRGLRLLPIDKGALERLVQARPGLTPLTLPANTYPRQQAGVATVASAALLLTTVDAPNAEVERLTDLVFNRLPQRGSGNGDIVKVSAENERRGVTIPLHPGAARQAK